MSRLFHGTLHSMLSFKEDEGVTESIPRPFLIHAMRLLDVWI